jgi:Asp-tRNA(Asn)/Glu-tRNA(Gln) amidotransferase B subunit
MQNDSLWFTWEPYKILNKFGIVSDDEKSFKARSYDLENFFDGDISGWYYIANASDGTDEAIKWILGPISAYLKSIKYPSSKINRLLRAPDLYAFVDYLKTGKIDRAFAKDILIELIEHDKIKIVDDDIVLMQGYEILDEIISQPKYKSLSNDEVDVVIEKIIAANSEKFANISNEPKLTQWFVGQIMKELKGKANGQLVTQKLKDRINGLQ